MKKIGRAALLAFALLTPPALVTVLLAAGIGAKDKIGTATESEFDPKQMGRIYWKYSHLRALASIWLFFEPTAVKLLQCQEAPAAHRLSIPFTTTYGSVNVPLLLVQATVNGKPATLIFDTGAQFLTITPELAEGLRPIGTVEHVGLGVKTESTRVIVQIKLGGVTFPYCAAESQDLSGLSSGLGVKIDGLLGQSVLSQFTAITLNYTNNTVDFTGI